MLDYDSSSNRENVVIELLKDPIQNIYMAARHLDVLRNVDFANTSGNSLTDEQIQIIASRYNLGPDYSLEYAKEWSYGKSLFNHKETIIGVFS